MPLAIVAQNIDNLHQPSGIPRENIIEPHGIATRAASLATLICDFFLVAGSSFVIYPAAGFPLMAKRAGAKLAILNRTSTGQDEYADLVIREGIGATLCAVLAEL